MQTDDFWKNKMINYIEAYTWFHDKLSKGVPQLSNDDVFHHWMHFIEETCDCEGCREDSDCTIRIEVPDEESDFEP